MYLKKIIKMLLKPISLTHHINITITNFYNMHWPINFLITTFKIIHN